MEEVVIDFGDASTQVFHIGEASVAVPGLVQGLVHAHARMGRLPWRTLATPALALARGRHRGRARAGVPPRDPGPDPAAGGRWPLPLRNAGAGHDRRPRSDAGPHPRRRASRRCTSCFPELGSDLERYVVAEREPLATTFAGAAVLTTPAPSRGGAIVRAGLDRLEADGIVGEPAASTKRSASSRALAEGYATAPDGCAGGAKPTGTTHVSVIDADGAVAAISSTLGSGSGVFRHGFQLNNMLGELDVIGDEPREPGTRLPSMMTPTLALVDDSPRLVVGSAGSVRLAGAIMQVTASVVGRGLAVAEAIDRPRLHVDGQVVHVEGGWDERVAGALAEAGWDVVPWAARNLFFGGHERRRAAPGASEPALPAIRAAAGTARSSSP